MNIIFYAVAALRLDLVYTGGPYNLVLFMHCIYFYYVLCGKIKEFNRFIITILFEVGSCRIVVG